MGGNFDVVLFVKWSSVAAEKTVFVSTEPSPPSRVPLTTRSCHHPTIHRHATTVSSFHYAAHSVNHFCTASLCTCVVLSEIAMSDMISTSGLSAQIVCADLEGKFCLHAAVSKGIAIFQSVRTFMTSGSGSWLSRVSLFIERPSVSRQWMYVDVCTS